MNKSFADLRYPEIPFGVECALPTRELTVIDIEAPAVELSTISDVLLGFACKLSLLQAGRPTHDDRLVAGAERTT